jgi:hypothetical protein
MNKAVSLLGCWLTLGPLAGFPVFQAARFRPPESLPVHDRRRATEAILSALPAPGPTLSSLDEMVRHPSRRSS